MTRIIIITIKIAKIMIKIAIYNNGNNCKESHKKDKDDNQYN